MHDFNENYDMLIAERPPSIQIRTLDIFSVFNNKIKFLFLHFPLVCVCCVCVLYAYVVFIHL